MGAVDMMRANDLISTTSFRTADGPAAAGVASPPGTAIHRMRRDALVRLRMLRQNKSQGELEGGQRLAGRRDEDRTSSPPSTTTRAGQSS